VPGRASEASAPGARASARSRRRSRKDPSCAQAGTAAPITDAATDATASMCFTSMVASLETCRECGPGPLRDCCSS